MKRIKEFFKWMEEAWFIMVDPLDKRSGLTQIVLFDDSEGITLKPGESITFSTKEEQMKSRPHKPRGAYPDTKEGQKQYEEEWLPEDIFKIREVERI